MQENSGIPGWGPASRKPLGLPKDYHHPRRAGGHYPYGARFPARSLLALRAARMLGYPVPWPVQYMRAAPHGTKARVPIKL